MSDQPAVIVANVPAGTGLKEDIEKAVSELAPELVQQAVAREEDRRFRQLKWVVAFIGVVGLSAFGAVANLVIERVVDEKAGNVREALELTRINSLALKLNLSKSFSKDDKEQAMALLMRISKLETVKASPDVRLALSDILRSFTAAGLTAEINTLFTAYQQEILTNGLSSEILLHHYGQVLVSRIAAPRSDDFALMAFEKIEAVAPGHDIRELALAYRVLYEASIADKPITDRVRAILKNSLDLPDRDAARFLREILLRTRVKNWVEEDSPEGLQIQRVTRRFVTTYEHEISDVYQIETATLTDVEANGVDGDDAELLAVTAVAHARQGIEPRVRRTRG